jgi:AcrR family transcriptional regulator
MDRMVEATVLLLRERGPDQVTVRDVAEASGHHHRFVQAWFGGKVGLFRAAFDRMAEEDAKQVQAPFEPIAGFSPEVRATTVLMNWLVASDPDALAGPRPTPIIDQLVEVYRTDFGLDQETARLMALRMVSASVAAMLFPDVIGITSADVAAVAALERELATLLAQSRGVAP